MDVLVDTGSAQCIDSVGMYRVSTRKAQETYCINIGPSYPKKHAEEAPMIEDIKCPCGSRSTLAQRGVWARHTEDDGREMLYVRPYLEHVDHFAVRCMHCDNHFCCKAVFELVGV